MSNETEVVIRQPAAGNTFIATYGSLRRKMQNFGVNARGGGEFVASGKTTQNFDLYRYGGSYFPSVSLEHSDSEKPVVVDVFEAPLDGLTGAYDMLEGYPSFYNRTPVEIQTDDGEVLVAWIYHIDKVQSTRVESGDWCTFNRPDYYETLNSEDEDF